MHEYLGMTLGFQESDKVKVTMDRKVSEVIDSAPGDFAGAAESPAANHPFDVNCSAE